MIWYDLDGLDFIEQRDKRSDVRMFTSPYDLPRRVGADVVESQGLTLLFDYGVDEPKESMILADAGNGDVVVSVGKNSGRVYTIKLHSPRLTGAGSDLKRKLRGAFDAWGKRTENRDNYNVARRVTNRFADRWRADLFAPSAEPEKLER